MNLIDIRNVIAKLLIFFIALTLFNLLIFIIVSMENQSELLRDNSIYQLNKETLDVRKKIQDKIDRYDHISDNPGILSELKEELIELLADENKDDDATAFVLFDQLENKVLISYNTERTSDYATPEEHNKIQKALQAYTIENRPFINDEEIDEYYNINLYMMFILENENIYLKWTTTLSSYKDGFRNFIWQSLFAGLFMIIMHTLFILVAYRIVVRPLRNANVSLETQNSQLEEFNKEITEDLKLAQKLQEAILPQETPDLSSINVGSIFVSLEAVSGDYLDIIDIDETHIGLLIVDVSGHGVPSALVTTMAKVAFNSHSTVGRSTADICAKVNQDLCSAIGESDYYLTSFYIILNTETMEIEFTSCGHPKGILFHSDNETFDELQTKGFYIGAADFATYFSATAQLRKGDKIIIYTDGVIEAEDEEGELYDYDRLYDFIKINFRLDSQAFSDKLLTDVYDFMGKAKRMDDISIICLDIVTDPEKKPDQSDEESDDSPNSEADESSQEEESDDDKESEDNQE